MKKHIIIIKNQYRHHHHVVRPPNFPKNENGSVSVAALPAHSSDTRVGVGSRSAVRLAEVRCYLGADLTSLAVEMVAMLVMFCTTYALFLAWSYGETMAYQFLTCVALEWLFCSDNTLNMFGWYVTSDVQLGKILQMIGFGVVVQAVPRLVGLPVLAHYFAQSPEARHVTSSLLSRRLCRRVALQSWPHLGSVRDPSKIEE